MESRTLRSVFSVAEILVGLGLVAFGAYSLWLTRDCPPDALDCVAWGALGAAIFYIPGILVVATGCISYYWRRPPLVIIQALLAAALIAFFVWLGI
jgi:hypothetical protein